jgi:hypothetical protein
MDFFLKKNKQITMHSANFSISIEAQAKVDCIIEILTVIFIAVLLKLLWKVKEHLFKSSRATVYSLPQHFNSVYC